MTAVAAMTLLLKVAASACPDATWTAAPAGVSSSWLSTCYKSSEAMSNLAECFDACVPGRPACLSSAEETRFILEFVPFGSTWEESGIHFIGDRLTNTDTASLQCDGSLHTHKKSPQKRDITHSTCPILTQLALLVCLKPCIPFVMRF